MRLVVAVMWRTSSRANELAGGLRCAGETAAGVPEPFGGIERAGWDLELGPEVVQMPAQSLLVAGAGGDQVLAVVDQQANIERRAVQVRSGELVESFLERGARDAERVDRVGLAAIARGAAGARHVLGRDPHDPLAAGDQEPLERAGHVPAVLDRPHPLGVERARPAQQLAEAGVACRHRQLPPRGGGQRVDRPAGMRALVRVRPDHDHAGRPFD